MKSLSIQKKPVSLHRLKRHAQMAESVDALVSNTSGATRAGSTPALGTRLKKQSSVNQVFAEDFYFSRCTKSVLCNIEVYFWGALASSKNGASVSLHPHHNQKI